MRNSLIPLLAASFPTADLIDLGPSPTGHSYYDPDGNQTIHLNPDSLEEDASISGYDDDDEDEQIMIGDDGREYVVRPLDEEPEIGRRRRSRSRDGERRGLVDRVSDARQASLNRRLDRSEEREDDRDERQATRQTTRQARRDDNTSAVVENQGLPDWLPAPDRGYTWERYSYDFVGANTSASAAAVTITRNIGSKFVIEKFSTTGTTAASLLLSLQYGDDYIFSFPSGIAVENYATTGYLLESWKGKVMMGATAATLIVGNVAATSGVVRVLITGYRMKAITC